jgi:predicted MFS family arabinose efflux permease
LTEAVKTTFKSLGVPNYRRFFAGQVVSLSGNWMQVVAETWLVLKLTGSGVAVGVTACLQFTPILMLGAFGGLLADRFPKRRLLMLTQATMALPALTLWVLAATGAVELWMVFALVLARGTVNALDNPTRQSFVIEMVGSDRVVNAVGLNSVLVHTARIAGPAMAGVVIATWGVAPCFLINAISFLAMLFALRRMEPQDLRPTELAPRRPGALREALRYVRRTPELAIPLALMAALGTLSFNFQVLLPLLARFTFHGDATTYAALLTAMGVGSVMGALATGARGQTSPKLVVSSAALMGALILAVAAAPSVPIAVVMLVPLGAATVTFAAGVNSGLQLAVDPAMRGRVMALYSIVFLGSTPIGGPIAGWLSQAISPRAGLVLGGVAALGAAAVGLAAFRRAGAEIEWERPRVLAGAR